MLDTMLKGKQRIIALTTSSAGAGALTLDIKPAANKIWVVQWAIGYHLAGKALTASWNYIDPDTTSALCRAQSINDGAQLAWDGATVSVRGLANMPIICNYFRYLRWSVTCDAAAQAIYARAMVMEFNGMYL